jgi:arylsulfatase A
MEKITISLHNSLLKKQIKAYAHKRKLTVSFIVENYLQNIIKIEKQKAGTDFNLPAELDTLLDGIEVDERLKNKDYKTLRDEMYASRISKSFSMVSFKNIFTLFLLVSTLLACKDQKSELPNIVIFYADDMGYGDLNCLNPESKIPTPHLDQLASEGMLFTDAHSSSGVCSPSRFAMLTGMYHWRRQHGIVNSFGKPFFNEADITLPEVLSANGYTTACIGKWHLGWDWEFKNEPSGEVVQWGRSTKFYGPEDIDWTQPVSGGPVDRGFDYYFGDGTINFPPYAWVENDRIIEAPTEIMDISNIGFETKEGNWEFRPGPKVKGWDPYEVLPELTEKAIEWVNNRSRNQPFFLYFSFPSPHAPIIPNDEFIGTSDAGGYGDFLYQTDWVTGQILNALKEKGFDDNTIVIFSSDNGPEHYAFERARKYGHYSMGEFRGLKRDVWEGGHRVPLIIKWPGQVKEGSVSGKLISQIDFMATLTAAAGIELPANAAPDSYNFLPELKGDASGIAGREVLIHNTNANKWAVRKGSWLYISDKTGQHTDMPEFFKNLREYADFETDGLLFNLEEDPGQRINLYDQYPEIVNELKGLLTDQKAKGYLQKDED